MFRRRKSSSEKNAQFILYACFAFISLSIVLSTVYYVTKNVSGTNSLSPQTLAAEAAYPVVQPETFTIPKLDASFDHPNYYDILEVSDSHIRLRNTNLENQNLSILLLNTGAYLKKQKFDAVEERIQTYCQSIFDTNTSCTVNHDSIELITNKNNVKGYSGMFSTSGSENTVHKFVAFPLKDSSHDMLVILSDDPTNADFFLVADYFRTS